MVDDDIIDVRMMHNVSIPVNGNKLSCSKHVFVKTSVGGYISYDDIAH